MGHHQGENPPLVDGQQNQVTPGAQEHSQGDGKDGVQARIAPEPSQGLFLGSPEGKTDGNGARNFSCHQARHGNQCGATGMEHGDF